VQVANHGCFGHHEAGVAHSSIHHYLSSGSSGAAAAYHQRPVVAVQRDVLLRACSSRLLPHVLTYRNKSLLVSAGLSNELAYFRATCVMFTNNFALCGVLNLCIYMGKSPVYTFELSEKSDFQLSTTKPDNIDHLIIETVQIWSFEWFQT
jgi:hypothetical protein